MNDNTKDSASASLQARAPIELELELDLEQGAGDEGRRYPHGFAAVRRFVRNDRGMLAGVVLTVAVLLMAILAPLIATHDPERSVGSPLQSPSGDHWMGTDNTGMDVFSRVVWSARIDLSIALGATAVALLFGISLGLVVGIWSNRGGLGGFFSGATMRVLDMLQAFPVFVLAMVIVAVTNPSIATIIFALSFVNIPIYVRLVRAEVLGWRDRQFIEAARIAGNSPVQVATRHLLPNVIEPALAQASVTVGMSALLAAGLSFVGAGVAPPTPEWGSMIAIGARDISGGNWWPVVFPGLALGLTVFGFALLGEGIRRYANPQTRSIGWGRRG